MYKFSHPPSTDFTISPHATCGSPTSQTIPPSTTEQHTNHHLLNASFAHPALSTMYSKSLALSAVISALAAFGHSQMGLDLLPAFQSLSPAAAHSAQNAWWQVSGYFTLNGTALFPWIGRTNR